ncbi:endocuticle structural glycoprotein SgAbd-2-like [Euwallacea fornicatus]|uniref:endocuticle structural glycoprotein SgAbd-2-like n=1 Tax=Euwallacea fornicatus TaxID=995702 RepID=UPI00338EE2E2
MHQVNFLVLAICLAPAWGLPQRAERGFASSGEYHQPQSVSQIPILHMELNNDGGENYQFAYETGNKIQQQEAGDSTKRQGSYTYIAPDGQQISMTYVADSEGFRPQGSHMPVPPPIPEEIRKAVEQNLAEEAQGIVDDGQYREGNHESLPAPKLPLKYRLK